MADQDQNQDGLVDGHVKYAKGMVEVCLKQTQPKFRGVG